MYEPLELDVADHADDHAVGGVVGGHEGFEPLGGEMADVLFAAEDVVGKGMGAEVALLEVVEDEFGGAVAVEVDLFDDDIFFLLNLVDGEGGVEEDVGKEFEAAVEVL